MLNFTLNTADMDKRLRAAPGKAEFAALVTTSFLLMGFVYLGSRGMQFGIDYTYFTNALHGDFSQYRYAHWFLPVFAALDALPGYTGFLIWGFLNILGIWFAARVFGGNAAVALLSYQMLYTLFYGQIAGVIAGGLGLMWWSIARQRWELAGLGLALAVTKLQIGIPVGLTLLLVADISWYARLRIGLVVLLITMVSLIVYPLWFLKILEGLYSTPPDNRGSIALFPIFGAFTLLLWLPPIFLPMTPGRRVVAVAATIALALPYYQSNDLLILFVLPVGMLGILGNMGYLFIASGYEAFRWLAIVPAAAYAMTILPSLWAIATSFRKRQEDNL